MRLLVVGETDLVGVEHPLAATTDHPVKTIAIDLGYHDVGYFCRLFRTHLMGTPNSYRAQMLAGRTASPASPHSPHSFRGTSVNICNSFFRDAVMAE